MDIPEVKAWLESQLDTATISGGNDFTEGAHVEEVDIDYDTRSVMAVIDNDTQVIFTIAIRRF